MRDAPFATLDDSMVHQAHLHVYTNALIIPETLQEVLIFTGSGRDIYQHEDGIIAFLELHIPEGCRLYACEHYMRYHRLWRERVFMRVNGEKLPRNIRRAFTQADQLARNTAKRTLAEMIAAESNV